MIATLDTYIIKLATKKNAHSEFILSWIYVVDSKKNIGLPQEGEGTSEGAGSPQPATTIVPSC
jgi:hypothetical protein